MTFQQLPGGSSPRIALFSGAYNHIRDGVSLTLNRVVAYLERQGVPVRVFAPTTATPAIEHAGTMIAVPSLPAPGRSDYRISLGISRAALAELDAFAPNLIHVATPDILGLRALRLARSRGLPLVATYHTHFASYLDYYGIGRLEGSVWRYLRWFYRQCDHVYVPSDSMTRVLQEHGISDNLRPWPRGVETSLFTPVRRSGEWRRSIGAEHDEEVVVTFVSRIVAEKGIDVLADVILGLEERGIPHRSVVVGDGPSREALAERLPRTHFTGTLLGEDLARAYASSDVFLFPSETETFGNVTLEAMSSGVPVVCADATGSASLVTDGVSGFLAPARRSDMFLEHVARLATDAALRRSMGIAARERALEYDWEAVLARLLAYYRELA